MEFVINVNEPKKMLVMELSSTFELEEEGVCVSVYPWTNRGLVFGVIIMLLCLLKQSVNVFSIYI